MKISEIEELLELEPLNKPQGTDPNVAGGYASDLLSDVMGKAMADTVWITIQAHPNIVAVAVLVELSAIILANGVKPDQKTLEKAKEQDVIIYGSNKSAFTLAGELYKAGVLGVRKQE